MAQHTTDIIMTPKISASFRAAFGAEQKFIPGLNREENPNCALEEKKQAKWR